MATPQKSTTAQDKRLKLLAERIGETLVDEEGDAVDHTVIAEVIVDKAAQFEDAPLQEFVPLLVENQTRNELRERGLHASFDEAHAERGDEAPSVED